MVKELLLLFSLYNGFVTQESEKCDFLTTEQQYVVNRAYEIGSTIPRGVSDYGMTYAAIALTESSAGQSLVNNKTGDYGVFQNNLKYTVKAVEQIRGTKMTNKEIKDFKKHLTNNLEFSASMTGINIEFWEKVHGKHNWSKIISSYNAGYNYQGEAGQNYLAKVKNNMRLLKKCNCIKEI